VIKFLRFYMRADNPKGGKRNRNARPSLPSDFLSLIPKWIPMIERVEKERK